MAMKKVIRPSAGAAYANEQNTPNPCRVRFIVPTADLSALYGCSIILIIYFNLHDRSSRISPFPDYFINVHDRTLGLCIDSPGGHK
jgi:hypothetical protein